MTSLQLCFMLQPRYQVTCGRGSALETQSVLRCLGLKVYAQHTKTGRLVSVCHSQRPQRSFQNKQRMKHTALTLTTLSTVLPKTFHSEKSFEAQRKPSSLNPGDAWGALGIQSRRTSIPVNKQPENLVRYSGSQTRTLDKLGENCQLDGYIL